MSTPKVQRIDCAVLFLILMIALLARIENLNSSLWYDEIITLVNYVRLPVLDILTGNSSFNNHLFYTLQAKASVLIFGESSWSVRLPATVFGVASVAAVWRLSFMVLGAAQAHTIALLVALSYHHVWFSQNARGYTELMFWCVFSTVLLINCLRCSSWRRWGVYGLTVAAGMYTHLTAGVFFFAQAVCVAVAIFCKMKTYLDVQGEQAEHPWVMPLMGFSGAGLLTLLLYAPTLGHLFESVLNVSATSSVDVMKEYQSPIWAILEVMRSFASTGPVFSVVAIAAMVLVGIGLVSSFKKEPLVPALFVFHFVFLLALLLALSMRIWPRFFFIDMGFILLFTVQGVFVCCQKISQILKVSPQVLFAISSFLMIAIFCFLLPKNYRYPKQDFDASYQYIKERRTDTENVVTLGLAATPYGKYYNVDWGVVETVDELIKVRAEASSTWLVMIFPDRTTRQYKNVMDYMKDTFSLEQTFKGTLGDGDILIYKNNDDA